MKHSDFQDTHHWLCGLSEYFRFTEAYDEDFELIFRALYHDNKYRKRDLLINMAKKYARKELAGIHEAQKEEMSEKLQSFFNIAMHSELDDYDIKARSLIGFLAWYIPDESLLQRTARFMAYFANQDMDIPNLGDFYSRGQIKSKIWLIQELVKVVGEEKLGNVVFYGGWYNFIAHFLFEQFDIQKIYSVDVDETVVGPCKRLYSDELYDKRFIPFTCDVGKLQWRDKGLWYIDNEKRDGQINEWMNTQEQKYNKALKEQGNTHKDSIREGLFNDKEKVFENYGWRHMDDFDMVINTSCEHMDNSWYENLPEGTLVCLHQNDYFSNEQHVNCMKDIQDTKANYPMSDILYEGTLDTHLYNRFMLIGRK